MVKYKKTIEKMEAPVVKRANGEGVGPSFIWLIISLVILGALFWFGYNYWPSNDVAPNNDIAPSGEEANQTEEELPPIEKSTVNITILNGSGVAGLAGKLSDKLIEEEYQIVKKANADNFDYDKTIVQYEVGMDREAGVVAESLKALGVEPSIQASDEAKDIVIIFGADLSL